MSAAKRFKRLAFGVGTLVGVSLVALAAWPLLIPAAQTREAIRAAIRTVSGFDVDLRGDSRVTLFPSAQVSFDDVVLGSSETGQPALAVERMTARLRLLPLILGRIEVADLTLERPRISLIFDKSGRSNWAGLIDSLASTLKRHRTGAQRTMSLSEIRISDGELKIADKTGGLNETLTELDLSVAWPAIARGLGATGHFVWRDEPVDVGVALTDIVAALAGEDSHLKVRLGSALAKLAFDGQVSRRPNLKLDGTLAADAASLRRLVQWGTHTSLPGGGLGIFALKSNVSLAGTTASLTNANVQLDGNTAEGVLNFNFGGRPALQGTLAASEADLSVYLPEGRLLKPGDPFWQGSLINLSGLAGFDLDLRFSTERAVIGNAKFGRMAIAATLRSGRANVTIGEAEAFGGKLQGSVMLARSDGGADMKAELQFTNVDLDACLGELIGQRRIDGKGTLAVSLEASGTSVLAMTRTLKGEVKLAARDGGLIGINVEEALTRIERRPLSIGDFRGGRTAFSRLNAALKISQGIATLDDARLAGDGINLLLSGTALVPTREFDLKGTATLIGTAGAIPFQLPFTVQGTWDEPNLALDAETLIRHSHASAPLFDAIKDRKTRDAVRAVVDQLTRRGQVISPPADAKAPLAPTSAAPAQ